MTVHKFIENVDEHKEVTIYMDGVEVSKCSGRDSINEALNDCAIESISINGNYIDIDIVEHGVIYKDYVIDSACYGGLSVQYCGDDFMFNSLDEATEFIDEITA